MKMFKQSLKLCTRSTNGIANILGLNSRPICTEIKPKWDLMTAVCVERHPLITKPKTEIEQQFQDLLREIEDENSCKSDHEIRLVTEAKQKEAMKKGIMDGVDLDKIATITGEDLEDAGEAELAKFPFASRVTEADAKDIKTSLERKLDKCLVLLVEQKIGKEAYWLPPQGLREDGETLRQTAERVLKTTCGNDFAAKIYGNAPIGFYKYVYPKKVRENGSRGAKIFFYLAKHTKGNVQDKIKYQWLDREELDKTLPKPIHRCVSMFLVPE